MLNFKLVEEQRTKNFDLFKNLFPFSDSSLLRTSTLLEETETDIKNFKPYLYKSLFEEDFENIDFEDKSITSIFYWYILEEINAHFSNLYDHNGKISIFDDISVDDSSEPPFFKLNGNNVYIDTSEDKIKNFISKLIDLFKNIHEERQSKSFNWIVKQIISDIIVSFYIFNEKELIPNTIMKHNSKNAKLFQINIKEVNNLLFN